MKVKTIIFLILFTISGFFIFNNLFTQTKKMNIPNEWFYKQRAFPFAEINVPAYKDAIIKANFMRENSSLGQWTFAGPVNIGGRITDVEMHESDSLTIYAGAATGGIFKSVDAGQTWLSIFDNQLSLSIGDLAIDPTNAQVIYAGTGEANAGGGSVAYGGMGIFKSDDAGATWTHLGLDDSRYIGRIVINPVNSQKIYVAAMGKLFGTNAERGVYRSTDGGLIWENKLFVNDSTGCIDLVINPNHPDTIFAAMWERVRKPWGRVYGGMGSAIYRSTDGGDTWQQLTNGLPANAPTIGRIGLAISQSSPNILYAIYADDPGWFIGIYKSINNGDSWTRVNDFALGSLFSSYGWWFGNIRVHPADPNKVYAMGLDVYRSQDGGQSWNYHSGSMHVDQHGLYIFPRAPYFIVAGNDGGVYTSTNDGASWNHVDNLPLTQFYTCEIDYQFPERIYGGTQDNGTLRTITGNSNDWQQILGGDGFYVIVDPENNQHIYAEYQWGNLSHSTDGGNYFDRAMDGIDPTDRTNWNTPVVMDPTYTNFLYYGANRLYRSTNRAENWTVISPDLSNGPGPGNLSFGTITSIAVSPSDTNYIYVGTDDGNVWVTTDLGGSWNNISASLPERWVTRVAVDHQNEDLAYVTFSGYRRRDYLSHIYKTTDAGQNWQDISTNLPEAPINDIIIDNLSDSTLYIATDVGVYYSFDQGENWQIIGSGLPNLPVTDLDLHKDSNKLLAATYGRSMYYFDLTQLSTGIEKPKQQIPKNLTLFQNYPNPFNSTTTFSFQAKVDSKLKLEIFDLLGKKVKTLVDKQYNAGRFNIRWNGTNENGQKVAGGTYIYRLMNELETQSRKLQYLP